MLLFCYQKIVPLLKSDKKNWNFKSFSNFEGWPKITKTKTESSSVPRLRSVFDASEPQMAVASHLPQDLHPLKLSIVHFRDCQFFRIHQSFWHCLASGHLGRKHTPTRTPCSSGFFDEPLQQWLPLCSCIRLKIWCDGESIKFFGN
jgi:hypothetical protein